MADSENEIPLIDFMEYGLNYNKADVSKEFADKMAYVFESVGFCYIKNHGIAGDIVDRFFDVTREFFELPVEEKQPYARDKKFSHYGWSPPQEDSVDLEKLGEMKEAFNYYPLDDTGSWPPTLADFQNMNKLMYEKCSDLGHRLCDVLSVGLGLGDTFLSDAHKLIGKKGNVSILRSSFYPPILENSNIKPGQVRLGEHSDYGTITILFQDEIGGLDVSIPGKGFKPAKPIPGTALVNIGDVMQRLTSDRLIATKHRVLIPDDEIKKRKHRQSVAFFMNPDSDYIIKCLDKSNKYKPLSFSDYHKQSSNVTY